MRAAIITTPYISKQLKATLLKKNVPVHFGNRMLTSNEKNHKYQLIYDNKIKFSSDSMNVQAIICNSEEGFNDLPPNFKSYLNVFKNKFAFRQTLRSRYPNFKFKKLDTVTTYELEQAFNEIGPFVIKPVVGYHSYGVYIVRNVSDIEGVYQKIRSIISSGIYKDHIINSFMIEELIDGTEYAIDLWYDHIDRNVNIVNVMKHEFAGTTDVSDTIYSTSIDIVRTVKPYFTQIEADIKDIVSKVKESCVDLVSDKILDLHNNLESTFNFHAKHPEYIEGVPYNFKSQIQDNMLCDITLEHLTKVRELYNISFPIHLEVKINNDGSLIPIEANGMRYAGMGAGEIGTYAFDICPYSNFFDKEIVDWNEISMRENDDIYSFFVLQRDTSREIESIDTNLYLSKFKCIIDNRIVASNEHPMVYITIFKSKCKDEIQSLLHMDTNEIIKYK